MRKLLPAVRSVHNGSVNEAAGHLAQAFQIKDHGIADTLPDGHNNDREHGCILAACPLERGGAEDSQDIVQKPCIRIIDPAPYNTRGNHGCDVGNKHQCAVETDAPARVGKHKCQCQAQQDVGYRGTYGKGKGIAEDPEEVRIIEQGPVIVQSHPLDLGGDHIPLGKTEHKAEYDRKNPEDQQRQHGRNDKQYARACLTHQVAVPLPGGDFSLVCLSELHDNSFPERTSSSETVCIQCLCRCPEDTVQCLKPCRKTETETL